MSENSLYGSANFIKGVNVIDIRTKWFGNFRISSYRESICPTGAKNGSSYREFGEIGGEII